MKVGFHLRLQRHFHDHLGNPIRNGRNPQGPLSTIALGYLHPPYWWREVAPRCHPIPELVEVVLKISLEVLYRLRIHTRAASVRLHLRVGVPDRSLGNTEWLRFVQQNPPIAGCSIV